MALAIDATSPTGVNNAGAAGSVTTVTTGSFSPPANSLLVALITVNVNATGKDSSVASVSNTGTAMAVAWARAVGCGEAAGTGTITNTIGQGGTSAEIWVATCGGSPGAITVSATSHSATGTYFEVDLKVEVMTDSNTPRVGVSNTNHSASGTPTVTLNPCTAGSYLFAATADWSTAGVGVYPAALTSVYDMTDSAYSLHDFRLTATAGAGSNTMTMTSPTTENYNLAALEIKVGAAPAVVPTTATATAESEPTLTVPLITNAEVAYYLSANASSLGGAIGATPLTTNVSDNVWDDISSAQSGSGVTEYRCIYVKNTHATATLVAPVVWLDGMLTQGTCAIGLDSAAVGSTAASSSASETTAPSPTITFSTPTSQATGLAVGADIPAGQYKAIWLRRTIPAAASAGSDSMSIRVDGLSQTP